jgi:hypothetical protein
MKTIKLKFLTDAGREFNVNMNYADPTLTEEGGAAKVQAAMDALIAQQPFGVTLASADGAELIDRTVVDIVL